MAFKTIEIKGGVVVPGTIYIEPMDYEGQPGFAVIADVFDTHAFPGISVSMEVAWTPFIALAECNRDLINSGCNADLDMNNLLR